ncbi:MAG: aspartate carbamoyltransferase [Candidatus Liptonbacteria bacterium RIFCSPLOWO2_01_FULL_45_15]|uniref:Aspartate carbamoyltransferase n=1 Tax=Candidatus Liptonbacteria bacterium RIFCSPLOWO2_01_FULL_45_15 TaxID=1798649 RepID=A0A1G2CI04_9BACT|nr:MAG: aspartate carbamoyltransferase [Candidatus Liptonbacteria bacterium RIFCSPLOWO2_01_FULL_45_15]
MKHIIESQQFDRKTIESIFRTADNLSKSKNLQLRGKIMASLFYEPSTRTRFSFESAMLKLGGGVITTENAGEFSSAAKGETLEDSIRVINQYADVIVLRHPEKGASARAAAVSDIPVLNAGDGSGQHPTQALLDIYTIKKEIGRIDGVSIAFVGDLKHGRTVRSLSYLLGKYKNVRVFFISPKGLRIGDDIKEYISKQKISYEETETWDKALPRVDVLYQTRIQEERFKNPSEYKKYKGAYVLTMKEVNKMKNGAIVMHPLPRVDEIATEVDRSEKAVYFKQAKYGLLIRMALLKEILGS